MSKLIVCEGLDGAGKSTQVDLITNYIKDKGNTVKNFHFPMYGSNEFSSVISGFLSGGFGESSEVSPYFVGNIYAMDQFSFKKQLKKELKENDIVLLDRYMLSNFAYQTSKFENDEEGKLEFSSWLTDLYDILELPVASLSIFFSVNLNIIEERLQKARTGKDRKYLTGGDDIHETDLGLQRRTHNNYLDLFNTDVADHRIIVKCDTVSADFGDEYLIEDDPQVIFSKYVNEIDNLLWDIKRK